MFCNVYKYMIHRHIFKKCQLLEIFGGKKKCCVLELEKDCSTLVLHQIIEYMFNNNFD